MVLILLILAVVVVVVTTKVCINPEDLELKNMVRQKQSVRLVWVHSIVLTKSITKVT